MRLRGAVVGALNLFHIEPGRMRPADISAAQAMADVATIAVLQQRATLEAQIINEQLSHALNSRVVIEQAKGMLSERLAIDLDQAFGELRHHARNHNLRLVDVALAVVDGRLSGGALDPASPGSAEWTREPGYSTSVRRERVVLSQYNTMDFAMMLSSMRTSASSWRVRRRSSVLVSRRVTRSSSPSTPPRPPHCGRSSTTGTTLWSTQTWRL